MRETRVHCDRCASPVLESLSALTAECGPVREVIGEKIDLCRDCGAALLDFIRGGRPELPALAATEPPR